MGTEPGAPQPDDDRPLPEERPRQGARTRHLWGQALVLGVLLVVTFIVGRACGSDRDAGSDEETLDIVVEHASYTARN